MLAVHALFGLAFCFLQAPQPRFRAVPLESLGGTWDAAGDINQRGEAVGTVANASGFSSAACWDSAGKLKLLGNSVPTLDSSANAINDDGIVVGGALAGGQLGALVWTLPAGAGSPVSFGPPATAIGVNEDGDMLLWIPWGLGSQSALMKRNGEVSYILRGRRQWASALAEDGRVAGYRQTGGAWLAFRWSESAGVEDLELPSFAITAQGAGIS